MATKTSSPNSLHRHVVSQQAKLHEPNLDFQLFKTQTRDFISMINVMEVLILYFIFSFLLLVCATVSIFPESGNFNVDSVRVCKILVSIFIC